MMKILSINHKIQHDALNIVSLTESELIVQNKLSSYDYIIISGGDGILRRVVKHFHTLEKLPLFILNPTGSFNVIAKLYRISKLNIILDALARGERLKSLDHQYYSLNDEVFLFSAGNMGDLQHIFLSETLRFGILKNGIAKYLLAGFFLFPVHLIMTPFMLLSSTRFFVFTPASFITKIGSFYGQLKEEIIVDLKNEHNLLELDGDVVIIEDKTLHIRPAGQIKILTR